MSKRLSETVMDLRATAMRGLVQAVHDAGAMQTVDVLTHEGMLRSGIEVYQFFGLSSHAVAVGSVVQLLAQGADPGDLVALPLVTPGLRFGNLAEGEVVLYDSTGDRVALRNGGIVEILSAAQVIITSPAVTITASAGLTINADITVNGSITATGDVVGEGTSLHTHVHGGVVTGVADTGPPA